MSDEPTQTAGVARVRSSVAVPGSSVRRRRVDQERRLELLTALEELLLREGFTALTVDDMARRLHCSKATLYSVAGSKEQLVIALTKHFFRKATAEIEQAVAAVEDPRRRIPTYLAGVGTAMSRCSPVFYADMVGYAPTAAVYAANSDAAARRVRELIDSGVRAGTLRAVDGTFAGQLVALAIEGIQSGALLSPTGLSAGQAYTEMADLLLHGLTATPGASSD
ncbi:TetR/AcrR family transcriptional regulator [Pseudonocardia parietis]|uniref:AcrR family transcriptional regulator n=1 Tax=Pseudonocardia parietis TaxID=570936 RepID=A0ABS4W051_9PSEU|nr:TetR/AcrR family transcriptional regulator [Pseudonocardia parietis]MBP2369592.1 AcrR family transcriptional regulator [Pseudonocardia parietis]